ncbi:L-lysine 6-transaminase [Streptosporangium roseum]|uniref:L-lysine-epsilon aminotransferase n=1 Tax=Streptosporangium roseum (strain ATCC 12428 / DSM 43021 / JCM 3005 / KCTC 9067 / NCIMB 10171 / NRRL 2505 / NI 9100) TaxID=479432 RepID=D2ARK9_STRRD|nr:L-lysine 6-transaminase [Streptosporangium roseum]ACZ90349.1 L-lysine aminotransferase [Streptosporangium roseum DSM 43021]
MDVHGRLARHLLVDGYRLELDLERSRGSRLVDARTGRSYLDFYTFFASAPLGVNPFDDDPDFLALLGRIAANKPANSDLYTSHLADFIETFNRVLGDPELPHLFFVEGGALAVENALKCAFDWKSRHNEINGRSPELGTKVLHLTRAFHGRSGYTLSLTNTDPVKTDRYPTFGWPRIEVPAIHLGDVEAAEERALAQARAAFERHPHDIACFIAEPIQGEGGDNHMRAEFLQAMEALCHEHDALLVMDEVQTGAGITGTPWAHQQLGLRPDLVAFAKKVQVGGVMAGRRVDLVPDNVFQVSGRINSTWGGGLVDMVRSRRMLEIVERDGLIPRAGELGHGLLTMLLKIQAQFPEAVENVRGRGLMCAFDLPDPAERDRMVSGLRCDEGVLVLPCGERSVRLRPALSVTPEELEEGAAAIGRALAASRDLRLSA